VTDAPLVPVEVVEARIHLIRGVKVMLDSDLADLYEVPTKALVQAVKRNLERFPPDFMFQLSDRELADLRSRIVTARSWGGRRTPPYAFTEEGVAMLSAVLHSPRAVQVSIEIMRAFVRMRQMIGMVGDLAQRLDELEARYDERFRVVFDALRQLMAPEPEPEPAPVRPAIGFRPGPAE